jgi:hypothetical protein
MVVACTPAFRVGAAGAETLVNLACSNLQGPEALIEQDNLRLMIQEKLADGRLPHDHIPRVWGGPGNGETCDGCGEIVGKAQLVMEGIDARGCGVQFHVACFYVWDAERKVLGHEPSAPA